MSITLVSDNPDEEIAARRARAAAELRNEARQVLEEERGSLV